MYSPLESGLGLWLAFQQNVMEVTVCQFWAWGFCFCLSESWTAAEKLWLPCWRDNLERTHEKGAAPRLTGHIETSKYCSLPTWAQLLAILPTESSYMSDHQQDQQKNCQVEPSPGDSHKQRGCYSEPQNLMLAIDDQNTWYPVKSEIKLRTEDTEDRRSENECDPRDLRA